MGYQRHHTIVVSGKLYLPELEPARVKAVEVFGPARVTEIVKSPINGWGTFYVGPDGSNEGWPTSESGDMERAQFLAYLKTLEFEDGTNPLVWAEMLYGDDQALDQVTRSSEREYEGEP